MSVKLEILDDITSETLKEVLHTVENLADGTPIELIISSYGGEILPTISIIETLRRFPTTANIIGYACSSAAILALSCTTVKMSSLASLMIHSVWCNNTDSEDEGIKHCNNLQMRIIHSRCPNFQLSDSDIWLTSEQCRVLNLVDNIYNIDGHTAVKYAAKLLHLPLNEVKMEEEIKVDEKVDEVKPEAEVKAEAEEAGEHNLVDVIEQVVERINGLNDVVEALKQRMEALENTQKAEAEEVVEETQEERIEALYKALVPKISTPQARIGVSTDAIKKPTQKVDYKAFKSFING